MTNQLDSLSHQNPPRRSQIRLVIIALVCFLGGIAAGNLRFVERVPVTGQNNEDPVRKDEVVERFKPVASTAPNRVEPARQPATIDPAAVEAVKRTIPRMESTSLDAGRQRLRKAALTEFQTVAREFQARTIEAERNLSRAQKGASEKERAVAARELRELQAAQMERLKVIAANSQAQIEAFEELKRTAH